MTCDGSYADLNDFAARFCDNAIPEENEGQICRALRLSATNIKAALAAQNACDCAKDAWATDYLIELNCIIALVHFWCPCSWTRQAAREDPALRAGWQEWADEQLKLIRSGEIDLCSGESGTLFPYVSWAQYGFTERNQAQIIANRLLTES